MNKKIIFFAFFIILIATFFLPTFLSTEIGKKIVVKIVKKKGIKQFYAKNFKFSWFGPQKIEDLKISSPSFDVHIKKFESNISFWTLFNIKKIDLDNLLSIKANSKIKKANIFIKKTPVIHLSNINGTIINGTIVNGIINNEPISAVSNLDKHIKKTKSSVKTVRLILKGNSKINGQAGSFDTNTIIGKNIFKGNITLKKFPTILFDRLFTVSKKNKNLLTNIFGDITNLNSSFKILNKKGPIDINVQSSNICAKTSFYYTNNNLKLIKKLNANVYLTKELSNLFLKDINPLFITAISLKKPAQIQILPQDFVFPLHPFDIKKLQIKNASFNLNQIKATNKNNLSLIIGLIKNQTFCNIEETNIWCSPVIINITNGILYVSRMDTLLENSIHLCTWGQINLVTNKVKMNLGLTKEALEKSFGIKNLPQNYVMQIPLKGTSKKLKIDSNIISAKVTALLTSQKLEKQNITFGKLLNSLKRLDDQENIEPPPKTLPWKN